MIYKFSRYILPLIFILFSAFDSKAQVNLQDLDSLPGYSLKGEPGLLFHWQDDFSFLDNKKWKVMQHTDQFGQIASVNLRKNVSVTPNGHLRLRHLKEDYRCPEGKQNKYKCRRQYELDDTSFHYSYTGVTMRTKPKYRVDYGYLEARIKFPRTKGTWDSFWTYDPDEEPTTGEVDIAEVWADDYTRFLFFGKDRFETNLHLDYKHQNPEFESVYHSKTHKFPPKTLMNWHTYALKWDKNEIRIYFDDQLIRKETNEGIGEQLDLLFTAWVENGYDPRKSASKYSSFPDEPADMMVDYVEVFSGSYIRETIPPYLVVTGTETTDTSAAQYSLLWHLAYQQEYSGCLLQWGTQADEFKYSDTLYSRDGFYRFDFSQLIPSKQYHYRLHILSDSAIAKSYNGRFYSPEADTSKTLSFYASGSTVDKNRKSSSIEHEQLAGEIIRRLNNSAGKPGFFLQTSNFTTEDNKEYWMSEYLNPSLQNAVKLKANLPVVSPVFQEQYKLDFLDVNGNVIIDDYPDYPAKRFRKFFPYGYSDTNSFSHSTERGPLHLCLPAITADSAKQAKNSFSFIEQELGETAKDWKILAFDQSLKSLNGDVLSASLQDSLLAMAKKHSVQMIIMGSEDYYAHWMEQGIHFLILGNGGQTTNGVIPRKLQDKNLLHASTAPHFAHFQIHRNMLFVDVIQGADYHGTSAGRIIESFAVPQTYTIEQNTVWKSDSAHPILSGKLTIMPGNALEIHSPVQFSPKGKAVIAPGGQLILADSQALCTATDAFSEQLAMSGDTTKGKTQLNVKTFKSKQFYWKGIHIKSSRSSRNLKMEYGHLSMQEKSGISRAKVAVTIEAPESKKHPHRDSRILQKNTGARLFDNIRNILINH